MLINQIKLFNIPSKIFEFARLGMPILYFGGGEGEDLVRNYNLGWVAMSGDYEALNDVISKIEKSDIDVELRKSIKETALCNFDFNAQLERLLHNI